MAPLEDPNLCEHPKPLKPSPRAALEDLAFAAGDLQVDQGGTGEFHWTLDRFLEHLL